jgi:hypothetical protein
MVMGFSVLLRACSASAAIVSSSMVGFRSRCSVVMVMGVPGFETLSGT